jgi:single-strand DNA-binding protein
MGQTNYIVMTGFVTAEPKLGLTKSAGTPVTKIRVGSTPRTLNRATGEWQDGETSWYNVKCWRKLAENVVGSLHKGDMILVRGKFHTRTWVDDQQHTRIELEIEADSVGHDMSYGWSHFNRGVHTPPAAMRAIANGEAARQQVAPDPEFDEDVEYADGPEEYGNLPGDEGFGGDPDAGLAPVGAPADALTAPAEPGHSDQAEAVEDNMLATV